MDAIGEAGITDNVVELMVGKIRKLPVSTQAALKLAACVGNRFDLGTLSTVYERSPTETAEHLGHALAEGMVVPLDASYKFVSDSDASTIRYRFLHDRVQQAAYSLIKDRQRQRVHLRDREAAPFGHGPPTARGADLRHRGPPQRRQGAARGR